MKQLVFILSIGILVLVFLQWKSCKKEPDKSVIYDHQVDSISSVLKTHDSVNLHRIVEAEIKADQLESSRDSALKILAISKSELKWKDKDIANLVDQIDVAEGNKDTSQVVDLCDSLKRAYPIAKGLVTEYILKNDSLQALNSHILTQKDTIIGRLNSMFTEANNSLFQVSRIYSNLSAGYKELQKENGKRFGFGPQLTVGWVGGRIAVFPGIGLYYSLIKL